jgi:nitrogen fixation protein NifQ
MCSDKTSMETRKDIYFWLLDHSRIDRTFGYENTELLARIYASWAVNESALPDWMGLDPEVFMIMMEYHFPEYHIESVPNPGRSLDLFRAPESGDLLQLLMQGRTHGNRSELWMSQILVAGCMGSDHLWQDLGLWSREDLSRLMSFNFQLLALSNNRDMKWKKFLYKQLCAAEGVHVCRAPSCEVCTDYQECFGSED